MAEAEHRENNSLIKTATLKGKIPENSKGGIKDDMGKLDWTLLPIDSLEQVVKVLEHGVIKYDRDNWRKIERNRYVKALYRHFTDFLKGDVYDKDNGLTLVSAIACNALFMVSLFKEDAYDQFE